MDITFDPKKRRSTLETRGVDFADAWQAFEGPSLTVEDDRFAYPERRFQTFGFMNDRLVIVFWTPADAGIRVISMRKCNEREQKPSPDAWDDDDIPEWTEEMFERAAIWHGDTLIRPATGTLTKPGRPKSDAPKRQVTLRLDPAVIDGFRASGPGWQGRINEALKKALGL